MRLTTFEILGGYRITWDCQPPAKLEKRSPLTNGRSKFAALQRAEARKKSIALFNTWETDFVFTATRIAERKKWGVGCNFSFAQEFCNELVRDGHATKIQVRQRPAYRKIANAE